MLVKFKYSLAPQNYFYMAKMDWRAVEVPEYRWYLSQKGVEKQFIPKFQ